MKVVSTALNDTADFFIGLLMDEDICVQVTSAILNRQSPAIVRDLSHIIPGVELAIVVREAPK